MSAIDPSPEDLSDADAEEEDVDAEAETVACLIKRLEQDLSDRTPVELEEACQQAFDELGPHAGASQVETRARSLLRSDGGME